jgi:hypothetical protein
MKGTTASATISQIQNILYLIYQLLLEAQGDPLP